MKELKWGSLQVTFGLTPEEPVNVLSPDPGRQPDLGEARNYQEETRERQETQAEADREADLLISDPKAYEDLQVKNILDRDSTDVEDGEGSEGLDG